ncbi:MAG TPA: hypothetical protein VFE56_10860 [Candidatus Binataceae bacterium]|jgi:hypothetical protein|nr:hypothetical protein [Candidatus Binataceae bacterium]
MPNPEILLAVLCDDVRHELSGKVSLMGIFDTFNVAAYTAPLPPFHIFAKLGVENEGTHSVTLRIRSEEGDFNTEVQGQMLAQARDELTGRYVSNVDLALNGMMIPRPGKYRVMFVVDGYELVACGFVARTATPPQLQ